MIDVRAEIARHNGNSNIAIDEIRAQMNAHLAAGEKVSLWMDGKEIPVVSVNENGMAVDENGQAWGLLAIAMSIDGTKSGVELKQSDSLDEVRKAVNAKDAAARARAKLAAAQAVLGAPKQFPNKDPEAVIKSLLYDRTQAGDFARLYRKKMTEPGTPEQLVQREKDAEHWERLTEQYTQRLDKLVPLALPFAMPVAERAPSDVAIPTAQPAMALAYPVAQPAPSTAAMAKLPTAKHAPAPAMGLPEFPTAKTSAGARQPQVSGGALPSPGGQKKLVLDDDMREAIKELRAAVKELAASQKKGQPASAQGQHPFDPALGAKATFGLLQKAINDKEAHKEAVANSGNAMMARQAGSPEARPGPARAGGAAEAAGVRRSGVQSAGVIPAAN